MTVELLWGVCIGLLLGSLVQLGCDLIGRKVGARCSYDCSKCKLGKSGCAGYYCDKMRRNADDAIKGV